MEILIVSIPIIVFLFIKLLVFRFLKKRIPQKVARKEFIKSKEINTKLVDLIKPLSVAAVLIATFLFEENNEYKNVTLILINILLSLRILFLLVTIVYSYYILIDLRDCLKTEIKDTKK